MLLPVLSQDTLAKEIFLISVLAFMVNKGEINNNKKNMNTQMQRKINLPLVYEVLSDSDCYFKYYKIEAA